MQPVIFLDRDGTINDNGQGYVHKIEDWEFTPKAVAALKQLQDAGYKLVIITNQSGIGHDLYTEDAMHKLHEHMQAELAKDGVTISVIAYCPHHREEKCDCRKPNTGMLKQIEPVINDIDFANSWTIGDKTADTGFGQALGTKTALIRSRFWQEDELTEKPDLIVDTLYDAVQHITANQPA